MAKNQTFKSAFNDLRKEIKEFVRESVEQAKELEELIAKTFRDRARQRLIATNNAIPSQQSYISKLANNIQARKYANGWQVVVLKDSEGLLMFLEYGTGLIGKNEPHPEAGEIGWVYAINKDNKEIYREFDGRKGWFWRPQGDKNRYIDKDDYVYKYQRSFKKEGIKPTDYRVDPERGGGLWQTDRNVGDARVVFSEGIKPLRYLYLTMREIELAIDTANGDIDLLYKLLNMIRSAGI